MSAKRELDSDSAESGRDARSKKAKTTSKAKTSGGNSSNNELHWDLAPKRRVTISEFKGTNYVAIREFYEKDGEMLPGKKGISLPIAQFAELIKVLPEIESSLAEKGETLPRPQYNKAKNESSKRNNYDSTSEDQNEEEDAGDEDKE